MAAIIIEIVLLVIIIIWTNPKSSKNFDFYDGDIFTGICFLIFLFIEIGIINNIISEPTPTAMDVYQGKTTIEYKIVDGVKVDSVVVFKNEDYEKN